MATQANIAIRRRKVARCLLAGFLLAQLLSSCKTSNLSQSEQASSSVAKTQRMDGCTASYSLSTGEDIEPRFVPGTSVEQIRKIYGTESRREDYGEIVWKRQGYSVGANFSKAEHGSIDINPEGGVAVRTLDDIELGKDTFADILRREQTRGVPVTESMDGPEGNWMLTVSFPSLCSPNFRSKYTWIIPSSREVDSQIIPDSNPGDMPWRSDIFLNKRVAYYTMEPMDKRDDSQMYHLSVHGTTQGSPSPSSSAKP